MPRTFADTNVWVYAVDDADPDKRRRAHEELSSAGEIAVSAQVLNEFCAVVTRKLARPMTAVDANAAVEDMAKLLVVPVDRHLVLEAIALSRRVQISVWDAAIVRAAQVAGCDELITEGLQDGQHFGDLRVRHPFTSLTSADD